MFTAHAAAELYLTALHGQPGFDASHLCHFLCEAGADFYGLPRNAEAAPDVAVELVPGVWRVPDSYRFGAGGEVVVPVMAGQDLRWKARVVEGPGVGAAAAAAAP
jgi:dihydroorotase